MRGATGAIQQGDIDANNWLPAIAGCGRGAHRCDFFRLGADLPNRPVKIIVPFAAGGGPDIETRRMAPKLADALGGTVVVENRVGAAGIVAAEAVTQAAPDGYTLLAGSICSRPEDPAARSQIRPAEHVCTHHPDQHVPDGADRADRVAHQVGQGTGGANSG